MRKPQFTLRAVLAFVGFAAVQFAIIQFAGFDEYARLLGHVTGGVGYVGSVLVFVWLLRPPVGTRDLIARYYLGHKQE